MVPTETEARAKAEGIAAGKIQAQRDLIQKLLNNGMLIEQVASIIGMKVDEIQKLLNEI